MNGTASLIGPSIRAPWAPRGSDGTSFHLRSSGITILCCAQAEEALQQATATSAETVQSLAFMGSLQESQALQDRKSTRLNSSHLGISYAVFCLKKKKRTR